MSTAYAPPRLNEDQHQVLRAILKGATVTAAARCRNLHRTTVHHWCRQSPQFKEALTNARQAFRASMQVEYEELAPECMDGLRDLIRDKSTPKGVRLKAYLAVLTHVVKEPMLDIPTPTPARPPVPPPSAAEPSNEQLFAEMSRLETRYAMQAPSQVQQSTAFSSPSSPVSESVSDDETPADDEVTNDELFAEMARWEARLGMKLRTQPEQTTAFSSPTSPVEKPAVDEETPATPSTHAEPVKTIRYDQPKPGRNEQCPCHSGIKYKKCCGK